jgi:hypothetical protein
MNRISPWYTTAEAATMIGWGGHHCSSDCHVTRPQKSRHRPGAENKKVHRGGGSTEWNIPGPSSIICQVSPPSTRISKATAGNQAHYEPPACPVCVVDILYLGVMIQDTSMNTILFGNTLEQARDTHLYTPRICYSESLFISSFLERLPCSLNLLYHVFQMSKHFT